VTSLLHPLACSIVHLYISISFYLGILAYTFSTKSGNSRPAYARIDRISRANRIRDRKRKEPSSALNAYGLVQRKYIQRSPNIPEFVKIHESHGQIQNGSIAHSAQTVTTEHTANVIKIYRKHLLRHFRQRRLSDQYSN